MRNGRVAKCFVTMICAALNHLAEDYVAPLRLWCATHSKESFPGILDAALCSAGTQHVQLHGGAYVMEQRM
jgi:hypothetical protein